MPATFWYEPPFHVYGTGASRDDCITLIRSDIDTMMTTDADGNISFDVNGFMLLAGTRLTAIPDPTPPQEYIVPGVLRSTTGIRPLVDTFVSDITSVVSDNNNIDLQPHLDELKAKSDAVTAYFNLAYTDGLVALVNKHLSSGNLDGNLPPLDDLTTETSYYRTTFINDWENESAPSLVSAAVEIGTKDTVTIAVGTIPAGRDLTHWRAYRSNSGNETAEFQYVPNGDDDLGVPVATTTFTDEVPNSGLQEVCPTTIWKHPEANLASIVDMANGIHVGFIGNTLRPSVAYYTFAFPDEYAKTVEYPVVGMVGWEQSAFVGTRGKPYFVSGTDPANLSLRKLDSNQACVSARGICSTQAGVVYPSPDGLCLATPAGVRVLTEEHFTKEEWTALDPENLIVAEHDGTVLFMAREAPVLPLLPEYLWVGTVNTGTSITQSGQRFEITIATMGSGTARTVWTNPITAGAKVYCEFQVVQWPSGNPYGAFGISNTTLPMGGSFYNPGFWGSYSGNGGCGLPKAASPVANGVDQAGAAATYAFTSVHRIGIAVDMTAGKLWIRKDGTWLAGDPVAGTGAPVTFTPGSDTWRFRAAVYNCLVSTGVWHMDLFPNAATQLYAAPTGFTPFQPL